MITFLGQNRHFNEKRQFCMKQFESTLHQGKHAFFFFKLRRSVSLLQKHSSSSYNRLCLEKTKYATKSNYYQNACTRSTALFELARYKNLRRRVLKNKINLILCSCCTFEKRFPENLFSSKTSFLAVVVVEENELVALKAASAKTLTKFIIRQQAYESRGVAPFTAKHLLIAAG